MCSILVNSFTVTVYNVISALEPVSVSVCLHRNNDLGKFSYGFAQTDQWGFSLSESNQLDS